MASEQDGIQSLSSLHDDDKFTVGVVRPIQQPLSVYRCPVTLDLIEVFAIEVRWYLEPDGQGEQRMGAIDNLRLNHRP